MTSLISKYEIINLLLQEEIHRTFIDSRLNLVYSMLKQYKNRDRLEPKNNTPLYGIYSSGPEEVKFLKNISKSLRKIQNYMKSQNQEVITKEDLHII